MKKPTRSDLERRLRSTNADITALAAILTNMAKASEAFFGKTRLVKKLRSSSDWIERIVEANKRTLGVE